MHSLCIMNVMFLLYLLGFVAEVGVAENSTWPTCSCISLSIGSADVFNRSNPDIVASATPNISYGIGCARHDLSAPYYAPCAEEPQPEYCSDAWCYVDARCRVSKTASLYRLGRFVSYAVCGYVDRWQTSMRAVLSDEIIVVRLHNSGGWKGSYCRVEDNTCDGVVPSAFEKVFSLSNARPKFLTTFYGGPIQNYPEAYPNDVMEAALRAKPNEKSTFSVCVYATAMGYVDLCLAAFTASPSRTLLSPSFKMYAEPVYLFSPVVVEENSLWVYIGKAFKPFHLWTWALLFGFIWFVSLLFTFQERLAEGMYEEHPIIETVAHASYSNFQAFFQAGCTLEPHRGGTRITLLGLGFFVMLSSSAYTANLATVLIVKKDPVAKVVLDDVFRNADLKLCSSTTAGSYLQELGIPEAQLVTLLSRSDVIKSIGSECDAGVVSLEDFQAVRKRGLYCNLVRVGDPLWYNNYMVTASEKAQRSLSYNFVKVQKSGFWQQKVKELEPEDACPKLEDTENKDEGMAPADMAGPCAMSGIFVLAGILFDMSSWLARKVRGNTNAESDGKPSPRNLWVQRRRSRTNSTRMTNDTMDAIHELVEAFRNGTLRVAPDNAASAGAQDGRKEEEPDSVADTNIGHYAEFDCSAQTQANY